MIRRSIALVDRIGGPRPVIYKSRRPILPGKSWVAFLPISSPDHFPSGYKSEVFESHGAAVKALDAVLNYAPAEALS